MLGSGDLALSRRALLRGEDGEEPRVPGHLPREKTATSAVSSTYPDGGTRVNFRATCPVV